MMSVETDSGPARGPRSQRPQGPPHIGRCIRAARRPATGPPRLIPNGEGRLITRTRLRGHEHSVRRTRLTVTSDPPGPECGITVANIYVRPDGNQLRRLAAHMIAGQLVPSTQLICAKPSSRDPRLRVGRRPAGHGRGEVAGPAQNRGRTEFGYSDAVCLPKECAGTLARVGDTGETAGIIRR
jgi:hypothetical protein